MPRLLRSYDGCKVDCTAKGEHAFDGFPYLVVRSRRAGRDSNGFRAFRKPSPAHDFFFGPRGLMPDRIGVENRCGFLNVESRREGGGDFREVVGVAAAVS